MTEEQLREEHARQHAENQVALGKIERRLDQNTAVLSSMGKIPVAVVMIMAVSALFYVGKVTERTWLIVLILSIAPWFGDSFRMVFDLFFRRNKMDARETFIAGSKLMALGGAALALFS